MHEEVVASVGADDRPHPAQARVGIYPRRGGKIAVLEVVEEGAQWLAGGPSCPRRSACAARISSARPISAPPPVPPEPPRPAPQHDRRCPRCPPIRLASASASLEAPVMEPPVRGWRRNDPSSAATPVAIRSAVTGSFAMQTVAR
jgi:hypothetical protein